MKKWRGLLFILLAAAQLSGCQMYWKLSGANEYYRRGRYPVDGRNFSPVDKYLANQKEPVRDDAGKIIGLKYFSSNKSGVGYLTEYFSDSGGKVLRKWIRLARVGSVENYKPFDRLKIPLRRAYAP